MSNSWIKLTKWEFWPFWLFYTPIYFYWIWLSIRARSFVFFSAANPRMELGGFGGYSKYNVIKQFSSELIPKTVLINSAVSDPEELLKQIKSQGLSFPLIIKPDVGERGWKVEKINHSQAFMEYLSQNRQKLLIQEYIDYPLEFGIMYHRMPGQARGYITSIVQKEFLSVTGDGKSTLQELFNRFTRTKYHLPMLLKLYKGELTKVLKPGEVLELVSIGNHARGTTFLNANHLITPGLVQVFDNISRTIDGFYFGRYDIRVPGLEDLYAGRNIKILELNGANSEPAHIYDPQMRISHAYKHLFRHWHILFNISMQNHKKGHSFTPLLKAMTILRNRKSVHYLASS
ncbi:hypothetical protein Q0590_19790 [Rhodocytophaga aerolata]|uniref:ATP-grasp fold RimK-type domain-containing protein n=1 Tax=Rhodocytophaga aerolata TaxID=455078 RepID=A0ABT8R8W8_9BACT|nr:hypothetical protein [Rhodocytophaga aerolata]MDO1448529.1 hypothetical protein [Rhodocytophaga aerolata]